MKAMEISRIVYIMQSWIMGCGIYGSRNIWWQDIFEALPLWFESYGCVQGFDVGIEFGSLLGHEMSIGFKAEFSCKYAKIVKEKVQMD